MVLLPNPVQMIRYARAPRPHGAARMDETCAALEAELVACSGRQPVFLRARAPTEVNGQVNLSLQGLDAFRIPALPAATCLDLSAPGCTLRLHGACMHGFAAFGRSQSGCNLVLPANHTRVRRAHVVRECFTRASNRRVSPLKVPGAYVLCVAPYAAARSSNILSVVVQIGSNERSITVTEGGPKW
jgi:hypothetical protein